MRRGAGSTLGLLHLLGYPGRPGLLGGAGKHDFDRDALSLRPEGGAILLLEHEGAAGVDRVGIENSLIRLARDRAGLPTLSLDETNDRSARPWRSGRTRGTSGSSRSRLALFALGDLLFASRERQGCQQQDNDQRADLHAISRKSDQEKRTTVCARKRAGPWRRSSQ